MRRGDQSIRITPLSSLNIRTDFTKKLKTLEHSASKVFGRQWEDLLEYLLGIPCNSCQIPWWTFLHLFGASRMHITKIVMVFKIIAFWKAVMTRLYIEQNHSLWRNYLWTWNIICALICKEMQCKVWYIYIYMASFLMYF